jgi:arylsulfatase A-like enzyme/Flp pilus assembly protein TadD
MNRSKVSLLMKSQGFTKLWILFVLLLVAVVAGVGWFFLSRGLSRGKIRNVVLISIDTCRADHLSCYGFGRKTTPTVDVIAGEGILFKNAYSPIPLTLPAHSSMLTGTYPPYHKVHDNLNYQLGGSNVTLAEILREHGYATGAVISAYVLYPQFGIDQGFDSYNSEFVEPIVAGSNRDTERRAGEASRFACSYLEENRNEPFFLFLHYYDPHTDYEPPEPFASEYSDDLYSGEIAYTDHCIAQVINKLKSLDLYDSTLIIIVGDHGEGLGEHSEAEHGYYIYQCTARVPFIIRLPGYRKPKKIDDVISLVDVVPTILGYLGIPIPSHIQGKDLSGYSMGKPSSKQKRYVYCESLIATKYDCNPLFGLVDERYEYIETTRAELYDLARDPLEEHNLVEKEAKRAQFMRGQLQEMMTRLIGAGSGDSKLILDEESRRRLESLGYVGVGAVDDSFKMDPTKKDAKDLIQYAESAQKVTYLVYHARYAEAEALCEGMLADWPEMPNTHFMLTRLAYAEGKMAQTLEHGTKYLALVAGTVNLDMEATGLNPTKPFAMAHDLVAKAAYELGKFDLAIEHWTRALRIKSDWPEVRNKLGAAYFQQGEIDKAEKHWTEALRLKPDWPEVHSNLAGALYKRGEIDKAIAHWSEALRLKPDWDDVRENLNKLAEEEKRKATIAQGIEKAKQNPDDPNAHDELAKMLYQHGRVSLAIEHWTEAVRLRPNWAEAHNGLATAFYRLGKIDEAIEHWSEAVRLKRDWAEARNSLATAFYRQGDVEQSIMHWTEAVNLRPDWAEAHNNLAWVLATIEDEKLRNPAEAVRLAERACELTDYKQPGMLDTLGVAYAAAGRFAEAVKTAEKGIELARDAKDEKIAEDIRSRLELYKMNKPYSD